MTRVSSSKLTTTQPITLAVGLYALFVALLWSGNIVAVKFGLSTIPPFWSAFWRMGIASLAVAAWARLNSQPIWLEPAQRRGVFQLGALFAAQIAIFNLAVHYTSPAYAVILLNANPMMVNLLSHFFVADDQLTLRRVIGLAIAFGGIAWVVAGRPEASLAPNPLLGNVLMLVSAFLLASRIVYTQHLVQGMDPIRPVLWQMLFSLPIFFSLAFLFEVPLLRPLSPEPVIAILYQAIVVAGFCFLAWTALLQRYSAGNLAMYSFSMPIFGVLLAGLLFGEAITSRLLVGAMAVLAGILIVTRSKRAEAV